MPVIGVWELPLGFRQAALGALLIFAATACQTALTPGSAYRLTGRVSDLVAEPTFDMGAGPPEGEFYSLRVAHYSADGHSLYDIPIVFCEQMMFAPVWVFAAMVHLTQTEYYTMAPRSMVGPPGALTTTGWAARKAVGWLFVVPGMACYYAGFLGTMAFDTAVHDAPVIVIGRPIRWLWQWLSNR